jgi:hypothetical protein
MVNTCWFIAHWQPVESEIPLNLTEMADQADQFEPGDVVKLKSGGPKITVDSVGRFLPAMTFKRFHPGVR